MAIGVLSLVVFLQQWREGKKERLKDLWAKKDWPTMLRSWERWSSTPFFKKPGVPPRHLFPDRLSLSDH